MSLPDLETMPPNDLDAERGILGSLIIDPGRLRDVSKFIEVEDFYTEAHRLIFQSLVSVIDEHGRVDAKLLRGTLKRSGYLESIGGTAYLVEVVDSVGHASNASYYAKIVAQKSAYRKMISVASDLMTGAYEENDDLDLLSNAERGLHSITAEKHSGPVPFSAIIPEVIDHIDKVMRDQRGSGLFTGIMDFDSTFGGLFPGELIILAARPGVGKTALASQIALHVAERHKRVYFASCEMSQTQLALRLLCGRANVNSRLVRSGTLTSVDVVRLTQHSAEMVKAEIYIDDHSSLGMTEISRGAKQVARDGLDLVIVDYLQLIMSHDKKLPREQQVAELSGSLKRLSRDLDVPVLCLCQLNRQAAVGIWPDLHNLRESGAIEQDADMVTFLHKGPAKVPGHPEEENISENDARWLIRKNRNGETGIIQMRWLSEIVGFSSGCPSTEWVG